MRSYGSTAAAAVGAVLLGLASAAGAPAQPPQALLSQGYMVFEHSTLQNLPASHVPAPGDAVDSVACTMARDEYESMQIGVHALADGIRSIGVEVESDVPVTVYHCISPVIKEELASRRDAGSSGEIVRWMPSEVHLQRGKVVAELPKGKTVNFWLTFRADAATRPGRHLGRIRVKPAGRPETVLDLEIRVRAFQLARPRAAFGMWLREDMLPKRLGGLDTPPETILAIYRDMAAHGHNSNWFYPSGSFSELPPVNNHALDKLMPLSRQAGLVDPDVPWLLCGGTPLELDTEQQRNAAAAWLENECRQRGWPEIIVFGPDEPNQVIDGEPLTIAEYDELRERAAGYLEKLGPIRNGPIVRAPPAHARDEAAPYRGKPVGDCVAGLGSPDV